MNTNHSTNCRDFNALKSHINGREFNLAQQIIGLTVGNKRHDPEHHQPCSIRGCDSDDDGFYYRKSSGTFHCRRCGFNGDIIDLVAAVRGISKTESFDIVASASGYDTEQLPKKKVYPKPQHRTVYVVKPSNVAVPVADLLKQEVSVYTNCLEKTPSEMLTIGTVLSMFQTGEMSRELIESIRNEPNKDRRNDLKKGLPAIVFGSEPQAERKSASCKGNGVFCGDCDNIPTEKLKAMKQAIVAHPYVIAAGLSVSGTGLFVLIAYEGTLDLKQLLIALQADFPCEIDKACSDVSRLRFATFDENLLVKDGEVFPAGLTERMEPVDDADDISLMVTAPSSVMAAPVNQWQPFPLETLNWTLKDFAKDVSESIGIDPAHTAISVLTVLSGLIGRTFVLEIKQGHREHAMLWCMLVAKSGFGKSPALNYAVKPLRTLQVDAQKAYITAYAAYKQSCSLHKSASAQNQPVSVPTEPVRLRYLTSQLTTEPLLSLLAENPYGITLVRDEFSGFFKQLDRYHQGAKGDIQTFLETHGGHSICVDRKTGERYLSVDTPSLAKIGGIQTEVLHNHVKSDSELLTSGFLARFLMAFPPPEPIFWNDNTVDAAVMSSYEGLINQILSYRGYAKALRLFGHLPGSGAFKDAMDVMAEAGHVLVRAGKLASKDVHQLRNKINQHLCKLKRRIIVFIDDLDRMTPKEISSIFQAIKAVANFPYTSYVLGYDSNIISASISKELNFDTKNGHDYLKKIVNVQFDLPPITQQNLNNMMAHLLNATFTDNRTITESEVKNYQNYLDTGMEALLQNPRVIKTVVNHYRVSIAGVENDVYWPDMLALSAIYVTAPEAYRAIANNRHRFLGIKYLYSDSHSESQRQETAKFHEGWLEKINPTKHEHIRNIIALLFPNVGFSPVHWNHHDFSSWLNKHHVAAEGCFDSYFQHCISDDRLPEEEWNSFLSNIDNADITNAKLLDFSKLANENDETEVSSIAKLLDRAKAFVGDKDSSRELIKKVLKALFDNEKIIVAFKDRTQEGAFSLLTDNASRLLFLFYHTLRGIHEMEQVKSFIKDVVAWDTGIQTLADFLGDEKEKLDKSDFVKVGEEDCVYSSYLPPIPVTLITDSLSVICERLKKMAQDGRLEQHPDLFGIVRNWMRIDSDDDAKNWLEERVKNNLTLFWEIVKTMSYTTMTSGREQRNYYEYHPNNIAYYFRENVTRNLSKRILEEQPFDLTEEQKELLRQIIDSPSGTPSE